MKALTSPAIALVVLAACTEPNAPSPEFETIRQDALAARAPSVSSVDLGALPGAWPSAARAINASRAIVGWSYTGPNHTGTQHAARWDESGSGKWTISDLHSRVPAATASVATAINAGGDIAGWMQTSDGTARAFALPAAGTVTVVAPPAGKHSTYATDINAGGEVVGYAASGEAGSATSAFHHDAGTTVELPNLGGRSQANSIADDGTVVGYSYDADGTQTAVRWTRDATGAWTISALPASANSAAEAINGSGRIAGSGCPNLDANGCPGARAYIWPSASSTPTVLGTLGGAVSAAYGVDEDGNVTGWSLTKTARHAFYVAAGTSSLIDLGSLAGRNATSSGAAVAGKLVVGSSQVKSGRTIVERAALWVVP